LCRRRHSRGGPPAGGLRGVEAVIDKDFSAALLTEEVGADALLLLTDVRAVWGALRPPEWLGSMHSEACAITKMNLPDPSVEHGRRIFVAADRQAE